MKFSVTIAVLLSFFFSLGLNAQCEDSFEYGGQTYLVTQIGSQCWMAENLNIGNETNGKTDQTDNNIIEKYCYENDSNNCDLYGGLYQWNEMMQYSTMESTQGICPNGWHLPSDEEYRTLLVILGMPSEEADATSWRGTTEGSKLAGDSEAANWTLGTLANDPEFETSGFMALPAGFLAKDGYYYNQYNYSIFWTSTQHDAEAWYWYLYFKFTQVNRSTSKMAAGLSVRCIKD